MDVFCGAVTSHFKFQGKMMPEHINAQGKKKKKSRELSTWKVPLDRSDMVNSLKASEWFLEPGAPRNKDTEIP